METLSLAAKGRSEVGKKASKLARREGLVPATVYGHGMKPLSLVVGGRELERALHTKAGENVIITLKVEGVSLKESTCLIKDLQHNPVSDAIDHVDFMVVSLTEKITVKVPLAVQNASEALGAKEGGILDVIHHEIEVECLPTRIPERMEIDVKAMKIGDAIYIKDLSFPKDVACKLSPEEVVVALHPPAKEVEVPVEEEAAAQPEVIEKGKKAEAEEEGKVEKPEKAPAPQAPQPEKKE